MKEGPTALFKALVTETKAAAKMPNPVVCCGFCVGVAVSLQCHLGSGTDPLPWATFLQEMCAS